MIAAAAPHFRISDSQNRELEYLLLGDLRQILDEPAGTQTSSWLLATLDMILVGRSQSRTTVYLPVQTAADSYFPRSLKSHSIIDKLRRLRDRVAHRSNYTLLANEIRDELREVMLDRMSSASCLYDA